jgi:hypothetical protein
MGASMRRGRGGQTENCRASLEWTGIFEHHTRSLLARQRTSRNATFHVLNILATTYWNRLPPRPARMDPKLTIYFLHIG